MEASSRAAAGIGSIAERRRWIVRARRGGTMENGIVEIVVLLAFVALAVLFFVKRPGRDRLRAKFRHPPLRRPNRPHRHHQP
ncbi:MULTISPECIES: hypothetical protein [Burkholderia]|nr:MULTISPECIES: hypothetical protein [Burkholderia]AOI95999.1 hypothetical protein WS66_10370 [Burkholderia sp. LA-2-3-30-S1-D2]KAB0650409.1 hypothetical protein F7R23_24470 [Burkholderia diffusa]KVE16063.1 hypothetical protein WS66_06625 [Burkholderia sp. LA-2-3-30-S1-D2]MBM2652453.1 hypothetical protein [Burkholderia diffusa]RQR88004.1 hypothetical protein DIE11_00475 [Burkholderia sp. Bp9012]